MPQFGEMVQRLGRMSFGMAETQLKGITPEIFAKKPRGRDGLIDTNTPAFVYGHLALYPTIIMGVQLGLEGKAIAPPSTFEPLFANGKPCLDDPEGTIYPAMDVVTKAFVDSHRVLLEAVAGVPEARFLEPNPREQSRGRFPTVGDAVTFMLTSHMMFHLGQVSAWRRGWGLGSAM